MNKIDCSFNWKMVNHAEIITKCRHIWHYNLNKTRVQQQTFCTVYIPIWLKSWISSLGHHRIPTVTNASRIGQKRMEDLSIPLFFSGVFYASYLSLLGPSCCPPRNPRCFQMLPECPPLVALFQCAELSVAFAEALLPEAPRARQYPSVIHGCPVISACVAL